MKTLLNNLLYIILILILIVSCTRKPLYLQEDYAFNVTIQVEANIDIMWRNDWRDSLKFDWKSEYGPIGYTAPSAIQFVAFEKSNLIKEQTIAVGKRQWIDIDRDKIYDVLLYNKTLTIESEYANNEYLISTPPTSTRTQVSDQYVTVHEPGEVFSTYIKDLDLKLTDYDIIYENNKNVYVYNINTILEPVSYIYIIQFIIINDDHSERIEARDLLNFTISGVSAQKNLFTRAPKYTGFNQISTFDIKDGQDFGDSLIFASRVTILDLLPKDENGSWNIPQNYLYYTTLDLDTYSYGQVSGTKDITNQLKDNPKGGIITVKILNSEIKSAGNDPNKDGFGIDIGEWNQHIFDIPF